MSPKRRSGRGGDKDNEQEPKKAKEGPAVGDECPDFVLETDESTPDAKKTLALKDIVMDSGAVIFFYPKANTGGCTAQACGFNDNYDKLVSAGYSVYGMSADKPPAQAKWKAKHQFRYPLLSDPTFEVMKKLGIVKGGKKINRSHIVIEKGGKIKDLKIGISPKNSVVEALETVCPDNMNEDVRKDVGEVGNAVEAEVHDIDSKKEAVAPMYPANEGKEDTNNIGSVENVVQVDAHPVDGQEGVQVANE